MPLIDDDGTDGSSFVWTIQNFSYCLQKPGEWIDSPSFILDTHERDRWRLRLYPRGVNDSADFSDFAHVGFRLYLERTSTSSRTVECAFCIRTTRGSFKKIEDLKFNIKREGLFGFLKFLKSEDVRRKGANSYLDNDTMTLRCRIWKIDGELVPPGQCYMRTVINLEKTTNIWSLDNFRQNMSSDEITIANLPMSLEMPSLVAMKFFSYRESFSEDIIKVEIKQINKDRPCFLTYGLSLVETGGKVVHSKREEHRFDASEVLQVWTLPYIPLNKILDCEKTYLSCELAVSSGIEYSRVERVVIGKTDILQSTRTHLIEEQGFDDSLKNDLQRYYSDGLFTDVTVRTPNKDFPVHKAILCARSTVFHAMFEQDMKENRTGVVDIEDIDADTVHKMLLFLYSDVVRNLNWEVASKLYFAADKYRITALRRRCSDFLKENLSVSNVCEVCVLTNMHQDEDLKSFVHDFILKHAVDVMGSVEWKKFMQDHVHLASETMHVLFLRNLNG